MNKLDKIIVNVSVFLSVLLPIFIAVKNLAAAILIAFLIWITLNRVAVHLFTRRKHKSKLTVSKIENLLALSGISGQVKLFAEATPPCFNPTPFDCGLEITLNCEKILIFPNYKFSACSMEEIAKFYRIAKEKSVKTVWILSRLNARSLLVFANGLDVDFVFQPSAAVRKYLNNRNMLPKEPKKPQKVKQKINFKELFLGVFARKRAKYFFVSGLSLLVFGILTPFRIYYLTVCAVCLILGVVCLLRENI